MTFSKGGTRINSCKKKMPEQIFEDILHRRISLKDIPKTFKINNRRVYLYAVRASSNCCEALTETLNAIFLDSLDDFPTINKYEIEEFKIFISYFLKKEIIEANKVYKDNPMFVNFLETLPFEYRSCVDEKIKYPIQLISEEKLARKIQISLSSRVYEKLSNMKQINQSSYSKIINGLLDDIIE